MIKGIDIMDNQNTNGLNENKTELGVNPMSIDNPNNQEISSQVSNTIPEEESGNTGSTVVPTPLETINLNETIEPVKPTLDSILNGNIENNEGGATPNPTPIQQIDTLESLEPTTTTVVEEPNRNTIPQAQEETTSNDAVVDRSAETLTNPIVKEKIETPTLTVETIEADGQSPQANIIPEEPIMEKIEEIPNTNSVENEAPNLTEATPITTETIPETLEMPSEPSVEPTLPPVDDFNEVPVPPTTDGAGKNRKKGNKKKIWVLLLILILIMAIGFGVYYFLTMAKNSSEKIINTKDVQVELGNTLSTNIEDYATISGYNKNDCSLNLDDVNVEKVSTYKYTITCGKTNVEGIVIVDDTTKPEVVTNDVIVTLNSTLNAEDFIEECKDASKCFYHFQTDVDELTKKLGEYDVEILVSDEYNNQSIVIAKLTVARTAPAKYLTCKKEEDTLIEIYKIGIDASDNFYNAVRTSEYIYNNLNDYNNAVNDYKATNSLNNRTGDATYNEQKMSILIKENKTLEDMNKDFNGNLPKNSIVLRAYLSGLGYTCN